MSADFALSSIGSGLSPASQIDLTSAQAPGLSQKIRIEKVSKAMESLFVSQLTAEFGKSIDESSDSSSTSSDSSTDGANGPYSDFIQQAMTQGVSSGRGFGLAKVIEDYLTRRDSPIVHNQHLSLKTPTTSYHVNHVD